MSRLRAALAALLVTLTSLVALTLAPAPAFADECYTWNRTLSAGASGADVSELQVRVAGWAGYGVNMAIDGSYGGQTTTAVRNFQTAYGLPADGVAGSQTFAKIYELQDADCTPAHFSWSEVDGGCGAGGYSGGSVGAATVQSNLLRAMWRAEALRHRLGDTPLTVTSGFRSQACDQSVGGSAPASTPTAPRSTSSDPADRPRCARSPRTRGTPASAASSVPATRTTTTTCTSTYVPDRPGARPPAASDARLLEVRDRF